MTESVHINNPLNSMELLAHDRPWQAHRKSETLLALFLTGAWADYDIALKWSADMACLHLTALFGAKQGRATSQDLHALLAHINVHLWFGFFCLAESEKGESYIVFRHSHLFTDVISESSCETLVEIARAALDQWAGSFYALERGASLANALDARSIREAA
jgi:hypothetical protein